MSREHTILLAGSLPDDTERRVAERFPGVSCVTMPREGPVPAAARGASVLLTAGQPTEALAATVRDLPALLWVHTVSAGVDRAVPLLAARGFVLTRTATARAAPMAEHVLAVTLALVRRLQETMRSQRSHEWRRPRPGALAGSVVGIVGSGSVGSAAGIRFAAFGARVLGVKRVPEPLPGFDEVWGVERTDELLAASDVVVVACPLTPATRGLISAARIALLRETALLVNVSRGGIVDEPALVAALQAGSIGGAALDVFEVEPLPTESPLWDLDNVIVTPHCSSAAPTVWAAVFEEFTANLGRFLTGEPLLNVVDASRGY